MPTTSQILRKDKTLFALTGARQNILSNVLELSEPQCDEIFLGVWSVKDLLAHLTGWDYANLNAVKSVLDSKVPTFYEYRDSDWRTYNTILVKKYRRDSMSELMAAAKASQERLIKFLQTIPPEHFNKDFGVHFRGYKVTIQRLLEAETEDEQVHAKQIADFFKVSQ
jgi:hypothetical protein